MARQIILAGLPTPVFVNETTTAQFVLPGVLLDATSAPVVVVVIPPPIVPAPVTTYGGRRHNQGDLARAARELAAARKRWQSAERAAERAVEERQADIAGIVARKGAPKPADKKPAARIAPPEAAPAPRAKPKPLADPRLAIARAELEAAQANHTRISLDLAAKAAEAEETLMIALLIFSA